jgi:hypothetical protein
MFRNTLLDEDSMRNFIRRALIRLMYAIARILYPDDNDRACAFAGETADLYQILCFRAGEPFEKLEITCHQEGGYIVSSKTTKGFPYE